MAPRLLVIDDDENLLFLYQLILEPEGYDLHLVSSGLPQVMDIDHFPPDVIILDYHVERSDRNVPLWQQLKTSLPTSALPLILCTADANVFSEQGDILREASIHLVLKPFNIDVLLQTIRQALQETIV